MKKISEYRTKWKEHLNSLPDENIAKNWALTLKSWKEIQDEQKLKMDTTNLSRPKQT